MHAGYHVVCVFEVVSTCRTNTADSDELAIGNGAFVVMRVEGLVMEVPVDVSDLRYRSVSKWLSSPRVMVTSKY